MYFNDKTIHIPLDDIIRSIRIHQHEIGIVILLVKKIIHDETSVRRLLSETINDTHLHPILQSIIMDLRYNKNI